MKKIILLLFVIYSSLLAHTTNYGSALEGIGFMFVSLFIIGGLILNIIISYFIKIKTALQKKLFIGFIIINLLILFISTLLFINDLSFIIRWAKGFFVLLLVSTPLIYILYRLIKTRIQVI